MRSTCLTVSLSAIEENYRRIRAALAPRVQVIAVVKADAYGHGAVPVARRLEAAGADMFAVAILEEALALREAGVTRPILILGGVAPGDEREAVRARVSPAVFAPDALARLEAAAVAENTPAHAHLKVDTGMARIGTRGDAELDEMLSRWRDCPHVVMEGMFTHFAVADTQEDFTRAQDAAFQRAVARVHSAGFAPLVHDAATTAIRYPDLRHDAVRPGIGLYGYCMREVPGLRMAQRLTAKPVRIAWIEAGETVGYGRTFAAPRRTKVMTVPIGYGDGYPRALGNRADLLVCGRRAPIIGRVCMDMLMADVTDIPEATMDSEVPPRRAGRRMHRRRRAGAKVRYHPLRDHARLLPARAPGVGRLTGGPRENRFVQGRFLPFLRPNCRRERQKQALMADRSPETALFCSLCAEISILFRKNTWQMLHKYDIITTNSVGEAMRIIAGEAKGRKLYAPGGEDTRPTADRIRESVFGILGPRVLEARVLDLFGGTGALALEALSRGAARATIVDSSVKAIACIRRNAEAVLGADMARAEIFRADYRQAIERLAQPFDLVFLDPPYRMETAYGDALTRLRQRGLLAEGALAILERAEARAIALPEGFSVRDARRYGETCVEFIAEGEEA